MKLAERPMHCSWVLAFGAVIFTLGSSALLGQSCETPPSAGFKGWAQGSTVYVYYDPSVTSQKSCIQSAFNNWTLAKNTSGDNSWVTFQTTTNSAQAQITVKTATLPYPEVASVNVTYTTQTQSAIITLDPRGTNSTACTMSAAHEIGHTFGLNDDNNVNSNTSVMKNPTSTTDPYNDTGNGMSTSPTTCDDNAVKADSSYPTCPGNTPYCGNGVYGICQGGVWFCNGGAGGCNGNPPPCNGQVSCSASGLWQCTSPIVIDSADEGFHLTDVRDGVRFRLNPNGARWQVSWTDAHFRNGWLALDRNGNGLIDDITELFGNMTPQPASSSPNGYLALAVFDDPRYGGNGDGFIDAQDAVFRHLRLWIDENHNGVSEPSELHTLPEVGVLRISLKYHLSHYVDEFGNIFRYESSLWDQNQKSAERCYDVFIQVEPNSNIAP